MYLVLIHWKPEEAKPHVARLIQAGYSVDVLRPQGSAGLKQITGDVDGILIDLSRLPTQGRAVGIELRRRAATRKIPLVFVGGSPAKLEEVRALLPDAAFVEWNSILAELERAVRRAPVSPVVPGTMAGYSGTPLAKKLGIKANSVVALLGAPEGFEALLDPLPEGVRIVTRAHGAARTILFARAMKDVERQWERVVGSVAEGATVWIAWPKKASGIKTDVTENAIRTYGLARGWVDYKICAVDETWSGLAFAKRSTREKAGS